MENLRIKENDGMRPIRIVCKGPDSVARAKRYLRSFYPKVEFNGEPVRIDEETDLPYFPAAVPDKFNETALRGKVGIYDAKPT